MDSTFWVIMSCSASQRQHNVKSFFIEYIHLTYLTDAAEGSVCGKCQTEILIKGSAYAVMFSSVGF